MSLRRLNNYWKEGKHADLWSVNHFLSGLTLGSLLFYLNVSLGAATVIALVLFVGWEVFEVLTHIREHMSNIVVDVLLDLLGFGVVAFFYFYLLKPFSITAVITIAVIFAAFNIWGFIAYEERHKLENTTER